jgi:hypothetical protein
LGVALAKLYLANGPASGVNLPENYRRAARPASRRPAGTRIPASPDLDGCRERIEVGLEHGFGLGACLALSRTRRYSLPISQERNARSVFDKGAQWNPGREGRVFGLSL